MKKGNLVLYKHQPALITDVQDDKFEITRESGIKKVREKDIVLLHDGECRSIKAAIDAEVPAADFGEAADFFEGETPAFAELAELLWGTYTAEQSWKLWQTLCASPYFVCTSPAEPRKKLRLKNCGRILSQLFASVCRENRLPKVKNYTHRFFKNWNRLRWGVLPFRKY